MAKASQQVSSTFALRKGDGTAIDVVQQRSVQTSGQTQITFGMNLNDAPVPNRRYVADVAMVLERHGTVNVIFGQEKIGEDALRSMLVVQMSPVAARNFLNSFAQLNPSLSDVVKQMGSAPEKLHALKEGSSQAVAFSANLSAAAMAGEEACLDFYNASPFSIRSLQVTKKIGVEPVVRVDLRVTLLQAILDELALIEQKLPKPEGER
jgi:hypothetical protein